MTLIEQAHGILDTVLAIHKPTHAFVLTSGGNDSIVPLHLFHNHPRVTAAVHIDTGIKAPDVEPHVKRTCDDLGLPLLIYRAAENTKADGTPDPQNYDDIVKRHGFPGPAQHRAFYIRLKERQIERLIREHKAKRGDKIALITGVRKTESNRRMGNVQAIQAESGRIWVAPITDWRDADMRAYRAHHNLPESPVSRKLGMSGECLCGAYAKPGELDRIAQHYPDIAKRLRDLQTESGCLWDWEHGPDHQWVEAGRGQGTLGFTPLCTSCVTRGRAA